MKYLLPLFILTLALFVPQETNAQPPNGNLIKSEGSPAVYFSYHEKRYSFPNERVFFSWYDNFDEVAVVTDEKLASLQLGGNVTFKPGSLIKVSTDPKVYLVTRYGDLHWVKTEEIAIALWHEDWNKKIYDVADTSFLDYTLADPLETTETINFDDTVSIKQIAQNMRDRYAPILTLLDEKPEQQATIRLDAPDKEGFGWSVVVEGAKRTDPIVAVCQYTWCEATLQYFGPVSFTGFTTVENSDNDVVRSNTLFFTP